MDGAQVAQMLKENFEPLRRYQLEKKTRLIILND